jgi:hypothetical protein
MAVYTLDDLEAAPQAEIEAILAVLDPWDEIEDHLEGLNSKKRRKQERRHECWKCEGTGEIVTPPRRMHVIHPSSISYCSRKIALDLMGFEDKVDSKFSARVRRIFGTGHAVHDQLQGYAYQVWGKDRFCAETSDGLDEYYVWGSNDGIIMYPDLCRCMIEIKTINLDGYQKLGLGPMGGHIWQATVYMKIFDVPFCAWWYYCKNDSSIRQYVQAFDPTVWDVIAQKMQNVIDLTSEGKMPVRDVSKFSCRRCEYDPICKKGDPKL